MKYEDIAEKIIGSSFEVNELPRSKLRCISKKKLYLFVHPHPFFENTNNR